ncbi:MAG: hypothetical protein ACYCWW_16755 [Deltaproteobacteria bacterium]
MIDDLEQLDLREVVATLRDRTPLGSPVGYLRGKSYFRDLTAAALGCSMQRAEELVDTLEMRGYLRFQGDPSDRSRAETPWEITVGD